ncbi:hypothetical protein N9K06_01265 [Omnitrophica bacterium]|nr:hypothetical protein [Candidatus Omnitrophota bacterium]
MSECLSVKSLDEKRFELTVTLPDTLGLLSVITGLLASYSISILRGKIRTVAGDASDTFEVVCRQPVDWDRLAADLQNFSDQIRLGKRQEMQSQLNDRIIDHLRRLEGSADHLAPINLQVSQELSPDQTVVDIDAEDTPAFLFELTNALSLLSINIVQMEIETSGSRVQDRLWLTTAAGEKIHSEKTLKALQWAVLLMKQFTHLLPRVPDPKAALEQITLFGKDLFERDDFTQVLLSLKEPGVMKKFSRIIGTSRYLWEAFIRVQQESIMPILTHESEIMIQKDRAKMTAELQALAAPGATFEEKEARLNTYKDQEIFRIDLRHILGKASYLEEFAKEFTALAEAVVDVACRWIWEEMVRQPGAAPRISETKESEYTVFALGKFGGAELGYASDLEIVVVYSDDEDSSSPRSQANLKFYSEFVRRLPKLIHTRREEVFEIDLRLRPYGKDGPLAVSTDLFKKYFCAGGDAWTFERQALIKLRPIAGSKAIGEELCRHRDIFVYGDQPFDFQETLKLRRRQRAELVKHGFNAKLSAGGLLDIEYLVQALQIAYGRSLCGEIRDANTLSSLRALWQAGAMNEKEFQILRASYIFLRSLINALRIVRGNAKDLTVPEPDTKEFAVLARRTGYSGTDEDVCRKFKLILERHRRIASALYENWMNDLAKQDWTALERHIVPEPQKVLRVSLNDLLRGSISEKAAGTLEKIGFRDIPDGVQRFQRICPNALVFEPFALVMDQAWKLWPSIPDPDLAITHLEYFVEAADDIETVWEQFHDSPEGFAALLEVFGTSRYLSKTIIANPQYWEWIKDRLNYSTTRRAQAIAGPEKLETLEQMQKFRHRETLRIALADLILNEPLESIYYAFSDLTDRILQKLFSRFVPDPGICVLGMGKLGGRELNFSSDVDLIFISEGAYDASVSDRLIQAFLNQAKQGSQEEFLYRVDLRLRPHGDHGNLCLPFEDAVAYYENTAENWEHQALIKARPVAGNLELGNRFVEAAKKWIYRKNWKVDQIERLREIKRRYEKRTQQAKEWDSNIKLGFGGIRDVEFSAQFLQLMNGFNESQLHTGHTLTALKQLAEQELLSPADEQALRESYVFYRRIENRLHLFENRQVFNLPTDAPRLRALARSLGFSDETQQTAQDGFMVKYTSCKNRCREIFERIFYG